MTDETTKGKKIVFIDIDGNKINFNCRLLGMEILRHKGHILIARNEKIYKDRVPEKLIRNFLRDCQIGTPKPDAIDLCRNPDKGVNRIALTMPTHVGTCPGGIFRLIRKIDASVSIIVNGETCNHNCAKCAVPARLAR